MPLTSRYSPSTRSTLPRLPLSLPAITITSSFFLILRMIFLDSIRCRLQHFGCQRNDLHELFGTQLACHRPEDTRADGLKLGVQQHRSIAVKLDQGTIRAAHPLGGANHHGVVHFALLYAAARRRILDADLDDIADGSVTTLGTAQHLDAHHGTCTGIVSHI